MLNPSFTLRNDGDSDCNLWIALAPDDSILAMHRDKSRCIEQAKAKLSKLDGEIEKLAKQDSREFYA